jgi:virulence-associated protein VagC
MPPRAFELPEHQVSLYLRHQQRIISPQDAQLVQKKILLIISQVVYLMFMIPSKQKTRTLVLRTPLQIPIMIL